MVDCDEGDGDVEGNGNGGCVASEGVVAGGDVAGGCDCERFMEEEDRKLGSREGKVRFEDEGAAVEGRGEAERPSGLGGIGMGSSGTVGVVDDFKWRSSSS